MRQLEIEGSSIFCQFCHSPSRKLLTIKFDKLLIYRGCSLHRTIFFGQIMEPCPQHCPRIYAGMWPESFVLYSYHNISETLWDLIVWCELLLFVPNQYFTVSIISRLYGRGLELIRHQQLQLIRSKKIPCPKKMHQHCYTKYYYGHLLAYTSKSLHHCFIILISQSFLSRNHYYLTITFLPLTFPLYISRTRIGIIVVVPLYALSAGMVISQTPASKIS